jgi:iron complex outermembrane receptor protein
MLQRVPGLMVTSRAMMGYGVSTGAAGGILMRGISGGSGQFLVLIDGHPQYNGVFGHPLSDSYQTLMAERVEVLRGPASVLYGSNAMGGVLNIVTRSMNENGVRTHINIGAGSYGTLQTEASNQVRSGRFTSTVAAQYNRSDNHRVNMGFEQFGGFVKLGYELSNHWNVTTDLNLTHWNASNPGSVAQPKLENDQWITRGSANLVLENHYERTSGALSIYDNFGRHKINDGYNEKGGKPQTDLFRSKDAVAGVSWYQSASLFHGNRITIGVDYQHIYGRAYYTDRATGDEVVAGQRIKMKQAGQSHRNELAGYVELRQDLTSWLTLDAAVRVDRHNVSGTEWIPQGGLAVRPTGQSELKAMVSKGFRNPSMREMYLYPPSNTDLKPERIWNYELSWRHRLNSMTYGANLFYLKGDNMIQTMQVDGKPRNVNTGEIENWGLEAEAAFHVDNHWMLKVNSAYLHMKNKIVAAPELTAYAGVDYRSGKWLATLGLLYINNLYTAVGADEKKENFALLDASVTYAVTSNISLWARGENLLAQKYEINLGYPMPRATFMGGVSVNF